MSKGVTYLHSHSGIEKEMKIPKYVVLIDEEYKQMFADGATTLEPYHYNGKQYYKVPTLAFVRKRGVFKNFDK